MEHQRLKIILIIPVILHTLLTDPNRTTYDTQNVFRNMNKNHELDECSKFYESV